MYSKIHHNHVFIFKWILKVCKEYSLNYICYRTFCITEEYGRLRLSDGNTIKIAARAKIDPKYVHILLYNRMVMRATI